MVRRYEIAIGQSKVNELLIKREQLQALILSKAAETVSDYNQALSERRGPAEEARKLYEETPASRAERERRQDLRRWGSEPAASLKGRPTKRDRRRLDQLKS